MEILVLFIYFEEACIEVYSGLAIFIPTTVYGASFSHPHPAICCAVLNNNRPNKGQRNSQGYFVLPFLSS